MTRDLPGPSEPLLPPLVCAARLGGSREAGKEGRGVRGGWRKRQGRPRERKERVSMKASSSRKEWHRRRPCHGTGLVEGTGTAWGDRRPGSFQQLRGTGTNIFTGGRRAAPVCAWTRGLCIGSAAAAGWAGPVQLPRPHAGTPTSGVLPAQLPLLGEAPEHLGLHEDLQEAAEALGGDGFAEGLALQGPLLALARQEQGVVAHGLHEEADKGLGHHLVQGAGLRA